MKVEIDQSWRIEYTNKPTVLADSIGNSVISGAEEKKYLQEVLEKAVSQDCLFIKFLLPF